MSDVLSPGPHHRETEFVRGLTGACGPNACAMAEWNATGRETHTYDVYTRMRALGLCAPNGASDSLNWAAYFQSRGLATVNHHYAGDVWAGWQGWLTGLAGTHAIVTELANGQALRDAVSGSGENAVNLHYHIICVYGTGTYNGVAGVWVADGDNFAVGDVLQFYSWAVLAAALPCAAVALAVAEVGPMGVPEGWHDDGATLTAPNGVVVVRGFRDQILNMPGGWPALLWPVLPEAATDSASESNQYFAVALHWQPSAAVSVVSAPALVAQKITQPPASQLTPYQLAAIAAAEAEMAAASALASAQALKGK